MVRVLDTVDQSMKTQWAEHEGFVMLQERLLILKTILEEAPDIQSGEWYLVTLLHLPNREALGKSVTPPCHQVNDIWVVYSNQ